MQRKTEKRFSLWLSWEHENEERWLDRLSSQGLHLEKAYPFYSTFARDASKRYVYRLDYQAELRTKEKFQDYIDLYADSGWEYTCTYAGMWHYFRRPWQPGETPELYTDRSSLKNHYQRIQRVMAGVFLLNLVVSLPNVTNFLLRNGGAAWSKAILSIAVLQVIMLILLGYGYAKMGQKIKAIGQGE